jgi:hypothetical protein
VPSSNGTGLNQILARLDSHLAAVITGCSAAMVEITALLETAAKTDHPYQDDTGNLTGSIRGYVAEVTPTLIKGVLSASMEYAVFVELAHGGKYAFLLPVIEKHEKDIMAILERHLSGTGASVAPGDSALTQPVSLPRQYEGAKQAAREKRGASE